MFKTLKHLCCYTLFWLLFFAIGRVLFILFLSTHYQDCGLPEILASFIHGVRLDLSTTGYFTALPVLLWAVRFLFPSIKIPGALLKYYVIVLIVLSAIACVCDMNIYREWGTKLNYRAISFVLDSPGEALASISSSPLIPSFILVVLYSALGVFLANKMISFKHNEVRGHFTLKLGLAVLIIGAVFLFIRGGWQLAPINTSFAYFSEKNILNQTAINPQWMLFKSILVHKSDNGENPYQYLPKNEARAIVDSLYSVPDSSVNILKNNRPNIVMILLESETANVIESLGGEKGVMPYFEKMVDSGVLFTRIYASGDRTDKGVPATLSGFPTQATRSIIKEDAKTLNLPFINKSLENVGYNSSFFYGGEMEFYHFKAYLINGSYTHLVDVESFPDEALNSKWGAHDHLVLQKQLDYLKTAQQPFYSNVLTLSNHEPFEIPTEAHFKGADLGDKFRSTSYYTDQSIKNYMAEARKQSWYKNTLFVFIADHGHRLPSKRTDVTKPWKFHIPMLFYGEVIKNAYKGLKVDKTGSQTDLAATLLAQLQLPFDKFKWSKNLMNPYAKDFAFYTFDNGFGWVSDKGEITFNNISHKLMYSHPDSVQHSNLVRCGKAYLQLVYQQYLDY